MSNMLLQDCKQGLEKMLAIAKRKRPRNGSAGVYRSLHAGMQALAAAHSISVETAKEIGRVFATAGTTLSLKVVAEKLRCNLGHESPIFLGLSNVMFYLCHGESPSNQTTIWEFFSFSNEASCANPNLW